MCDEHCKTDVPAENAVVANTQAQISDKPAKDYSINEPFSFLNAAVIATFEAAIAGGQPLFFTQQPPVPVPEGESDPGYLFLIRQKALPDDKTRQQQNCFTCRDFLRVYGGLVTIDPETGLTTSALWDPEVVSEINKPAIAALKAAVESLPVVDFYDGKPLHKDETPGYIGTGEKGNFKHFSVPVHNVVGRAHGTRAGAPEAYKVLANFMNQWTVELLEVCTTYFKNDQRLKCYPFFGGHIDFTTELKKKIAATKHELHRANLVWHAVAAQGPARLFFGNTVGGTFVDSIKAGATLDSAIRMFEAKVDPKFYLRPTEEASVGNVEQLKKVFDELGLEPSLGRRSLRLDEIPEAAFYWRPKAPAEAPPVSAIDGLLSELKQKKKEDGIVLERMAGGNLTWLRFKDEVLPKADKITVTFQEGRYAPTFLVTAIDPNAPPILRWDSEEHRNTVSSYGYIEKLNPREFGVFPHQEVEIKGFTCSVQSIMAKEPDHDRVFIVIDGVHDTREGGGLGLFPQDLREELHPVRSAMEMISNRGTMQGRSDGCGGFFIVKESPSLNMDVKVYTGNAVVDYTIDRFF